MKLYRELDLTRFEPWSGAIDTYNTIADADKLDELEFLLSDLYPEGIEETQLNDLLWFDSEWLLESLGITDNQEWVLNSDDIDKLEQSSLFYEVTINFMRDWLGNGFNVVTVTTEELKEYEGELTSEQIELLNELG
jgi:hypothetical protein